MASFEDGPIGSATIDVMTCAVRGRFSVTLAMIRIAMRAITATPAPAIRRIVVGSNASAGVGCIVTATRATTRTRLRHRMNVTGSSFCQSLRWG